MEELLYPPKVWRYDPPGGDTGSMVPYELYEMAMARNKPGDILTAFAGAPGVGMIRHRITRMDETGVYAVVVSNTIRELTVEDVI